MMKGPTQITRRERQITWIIRAGQWRERITALATDWIVKMSGAQHSAASEPPEIRCDYGRARRRRLVRQVRLGSPEYAADARAEARKPRYELTLAFCRRQGLFAANSRWENREECPARAEGRCVGVFQPATWPRQTAPIKPSFFQNPYCGASEYSTTNRSFTSAP